jgi:uncharacterized protein (UPF0333 family)
MFFNKKGQTATEYLIILAVVIVVALIVVGVMGGIPGIDQGVGRKASASYWKSADVSIDAYAVTSAGEVTLNIRNALDTTITITAFTVSTAAVDNTAGDIAGLNGLTISPGQSVSLISAAIALPCSGSFSHGISITYTDKATDAEYTVDGDGHKLEGACAN